MSVGQQRALVGLALTAYLIAVGLQLFWLIAAGSPLEIGIGILVGLLPLVGFWLLWKELNFNWRVQAMASTFEQAPVVDESRLRDPAHWQAWFVVAAGYDQDGDRKRARAAMRKALGLYSQ